MFFDRKLIPVSARVGSLCFQLQKVVVVLLGIGLKLLYMRGGEYGEQSVHVVAVVVLVSLGNQGEVPSRTVVVGDKESA